MDGLRRLLDTLGRWPVALAACALLAVAMLVPALGSSGLWDPQERQLADRAAPLTTPAEAAPAPTPKSRHQDHDDDDDDDDACPRSAPDDAVARSLTPRAIAWGRDLRDAPLWPGGDDASRRMPLAVLGLLTVLAAVGTAIRGGGGRAGLIAAVVLLAMPLLALQARMLTSEIGTACGGALLIYGLVAFATPVRGWRSGGPSSAVATIVDLAVATIAVFAGVVIGFAGGGALLGLLVPIGAFAAAGAFGVGLVRDLARGRSGGRHVAALAAALATIGLVTVLAYELYQWKTPYPGMTPPPARQVFGEAILADGCWSSALGATWRAQDDLRRVFDSTFEQIAYGTFPWGIVAPVAMFALIAYGDARRRLIGAVTLAWAGAAWIAAEAFQRKAGFTIWAGFPALAIAIGVWLEDALARRPDGRPDAPPDRPPALPVAAAMLIALFVGLAVIDFGKDLQSFPEKLTSLLIDGDTIPYPKDARLGLPVRLWLLVLGGLGALGLGLGLAVWRPGGDRAARIRRAVAGAGLATALATTIGLAAFWGYAWQPRLADYLSSKPMLETFEALRAPNDPLYVMGDLGEALHSYTEVTPTKAPSRAAIIGALKQPQRVFAIAPQSELCSIHREMGDTRYYVVYERNLRSLLLSNRVDGTTDKNPLGAMIAHHPPTGISHRPKGRVVWDNKIELLGWDLPAKVDGSDDFEVVTYYKILAPVGGAWTMLMHFDSKRGVRLQGGDHKPIDDRCPTSTWMPGDYIIDHHTMHGEGNPNGTYYLWLGFFTGSAPSFRNMRLSAVPGDLTDGTDRVRLGPITLD